MSWTASGRAISRALLAVVLAVGGASAQTPAEERPLSLAEALAEARAGNAGLAIAEARREIAASEARREGAFLWPLVSAGAEVVRSTDPVFVFGTKLRQGRFGEADFAVDALVDPDPVEDWVSAADVSWGVVDPGRWAGWDAARHGSRAAEWAATRAREATELGARTRYWEAVRASARAAAARAAEEAARGTLDRFEARRERGLLTEADRLQALAERSAATARRIDADRAERETRRALGVFLGWEPDVLPVPTDTLTIPAPYRPGPFDPEARADLRAGRAALEAREARTRQATAALLPAVDAFGRVAAHASDGPGADDDDWTVGVRLRWTAFAGFGRSAERRAARAAERIARLEYEQAVREARAEVEAADRAVESAAAAAEAALAARRAAEEATALMRRRFEEGLASPADLLQAEARDAAMRAAAVDALAGWRLAVARAAFARSLDDPEDP